MKKLVIILTIMTLLICSGCVYNPSLEPTPELAPALSPSETPGEAEGPPPPVRLPPGGEGEPPADMTWISPGIVEISNFYAGARAEWPIKIHNGSDTTATFEVKYKTPDRLREGYEMAPQDAQTWVMVVDPTPVILPKETIEVLIILEMPNDVKVSPKKWEFWVAVKDTSQRGFVQTELCSRWLISMRT